MRQLDLPDDIGRKVMLASVAAGLSDRDYVLACVTAGLMTHAEHDALLAAAFKLIGVAG